MNCCLKTDRGIIAYDLERSVRKYLTVQVADNGDICVRAPIHLPSANIENFIHKKSAWILRRSQEQKERFARHAAKVFAEGAEFYFLGRKYPLYIIRKDSVREGIDFNGKAWSVQLPYGMERSGESGGIKKALVRWYRQQAQELLAARVFHYARITGLAPETIRVKTQKRLWGSCNQARKAIDLNWQVIMSPLSVIDYVVVHELCHLRFADHSSRFWREVGRFIPDYKSKHRWLKDNAWDMRLPEDDVYERNKDT